MAALIDSKAAWTRHDCALEPARCGRDERARRSTARARHGHAFLRTIRSPYDGHDVQPWPPGHNHADEQHRFGQVARQWNLIHKQGSPEWKALLTELKARNVILDPTMTAYLASRDVMARRNADWHETYTLPSLWDFYQPSRANHGSYYFDWTSWDEAAWRSFYRVWMTFLNDYKNMGGRECRELRRRVHLQHLRLLHHRRDGAAAGGRIPSARSDPGSDPARRPGAFRAQEEADRVRRGPGGLLADLVVVPENPIANLKVLYGTGAGRLNEKTGKAERIGGIRYTIKDGIVYDARQLLADVARMVEKQKTERGITRLPDIAFPSPRP